MGISDTAHPNNEKQNMSEWTDPAEIIGEFSIERLGHVAADSAVRAPASFVSARSRAER